MAVHARDILVGRLLERAMLQTQSASAAVGEREVDGFTVAGQALLRAPLTGRCEVGEADDAGGDEKDE
jgi:hypothetical protein